MSSHSPSREVLETFRFSAEPWSSTEAAMQHLETCGLCREEVGLDQALALRVREALEERTAGATPSPFAWSLVRDRALRGEETRRRPVSLLGRLATLALVNGGSRKGLNDRLSDSLGSRPRPEWWHTGSVRVLA